MLSLQWFPLLGLSVGQSGWVAMGLGSPFTLERALLQIFIEFFSNLCHSVHCGKMIKCFFNVGIAGVVHEK